MRRRRREAGSGIYSTTSITIVPPRQGMFFIISWVIGIMLALR